MEHTYWIRNTYIHFIYIHIFFIGISTIEKTSMKCNINRQYHGTYTPVHHIKVIQCTIQTKNNYKILLRQKYIYY